MYSKSGFNQMSALWRPFDAGSGRSNFSFSLSSRYTLTILFLFIFVINLLLVSVCGNPGVTRVATYPQRDLNWKSKYNWTTQSQSTLNNVPIKTQNPQSDGERSFSSRSLNLDATGTGAGESMMMSASEKAEGMDYMYYYYDEAENPNQNPSVTSEMNSGKKGQQLMSPDPTTMSSTSTSTNRKGRRRRLTPLHKKTNKYFQPDSFMRRSGITSSSSEEEFTSNNNNNNQEITVKISRRSDQEASESLSRINFSNSSAPITTDLKSSLYPGSIRNANLFHPLISESDSDHADPIPFLDMSKMILPENQKGDEDSGGNKRVKHTLRPDWSVKVAPDLLPNFVLSHDSHGHEHAPHSLLSKDTVIAYDKNYFKHHHDNDLELLSGNEKDKDRENNDKENKEKKSLAPVYNKHSVKKPSASATTITSTSGNDRDIFQSTESVSTGKVFTQPVHSIPPVIRIQRTSTPPTTTSTTTAKTTPLPTSSKIPFTLRPKPETTFETTKTTTPVSTTTTTKVPEITKEITEINTNEAPLILMPPYNNDRDPPKPVTLTTPQPTAEPRVTQSTAPSVDDALLLQQLLASLGVSNDDIGLVLTSQNSNSIQQQTQQQQQPKPQPPAATRPTRAPSTATRKPTRRTTKPPRRVTTQPGGLFGFLNLFTQPPNNGIAATTTTARPLFSFGNFGQTNQNPAPASNDIFNIFNLFTQPTTQRPSPRPQRQPQPNIQQQQQQQQLLAGNGNGNGLSLGNILAPSSQPPQVQVQSQRTTPRPNDFFGGIFNIFNQPQTTPRPSTGLFDFLNIFNQPTTRRPSLLGGGGLLGGLLNLLAPASSQIHSQTVLPNANGGEAGKFLITTTTPVPNLFGSNSNSNGNANGNLFNFGGLGLGSQGNLQQNNDLNALIQQTLLLQSLQNNNNNNNLINNLVSNNLESGRSLNSLSNTNTNNLFGIFSPSPSSTPLENLNSASASNLQEVLIAAPDEPLVSILPAPTTTPTPRNNYNTPGSGFDHDSGLSDADLKRIYAIIDKQSENIVTLTLGHSTAETPTIPYENEKEKENKRIKYGQLKSTVQKTNFGKDENIRTTTSKSTITSTTKSPTISTESFQITQSNSEKNNEISSEQHEKNQDTLSNSGELVEEKTRRLKLLYQLLSLNRIPQSAALTQLILRHQEKLKEDAEQEEKIRKIRSTSTSIEPPTIPPIQNSDLINHNHNHNNTHNVTILNEKVEKIVNISKINILGDSTVQLPSVKSNSSNESTNSTSNKRVIPATTTQPFTLKVQKIERRSSSDSTPEANENNSKKSKTAKTKSKLKSESETESQSAAESSFLDTIVNQFRPTAATPKGLYYWLDVNAFMGDQIERRSGGGQSLGGLRPKMGRKDLFL